MSTILTVDIIQVFESILIQLAYLMPSFFGLYIIFYFTRQLLFDSK